MWGLYLWLSLLLVCNLHKLTNQLALNYDDDANHKLGLGPQRARLEITPDMPVAIAYQEASEHALICRGINAEPGMFANIRWNGPNDDDNYVELESKHEVTEGPVDRSKTLVFRRPTNDDSGIYTCTANFNSELLTANISVKFHELLRFTNCPTRQVLNKGDTNGKITCQVTGEKPQLYISKNNQLIQTTRYVTNPDGIEILGAVNESDAGEFTFKVRSGGKQKTERIKVEVHSMPEIVPYTGPQPEFYAIEGSEAQLNCTAIGEPKPLVEWIGPRGTNLSTIGSNYHVNQVEGSLIIDRTNRHDDEGKYTCRAYNSVGHRDKIVELGVYTKPLITKFENMTADDQSTVTFECRASGYPKPTFSIRKAGNNEQAFMSGDNFVTDINESVEEAGLNVYVYRVKVRVNKALAGPMYCNATNMAGSVERVGHLSVRFAPDLTRTPSTAILTRGQVAVLTCVIDAYPEPTVTWFVNNAQVINGTFNMTYDTNFQHYIHRFTPREADINGLSKYTCRVSNSMGQAEKNIDVVMSRPPGRTNVAKSGREPTTASLELSVTDDGWLQIKRYKYSLYGTYSIANSPEPHPVHTVDGFFEASPKISNYTLRNLFPQYIYRLTIKAINDRGEGDESQFTFETGPATRPTPPIIFRSGPSDLGEATPTEYRNGYVLKWFPPHLDNGGPIIKYIIKVNKLNNDGLDLPEEFPERVVDHMGERPLTAKIGPLTPNARYKIQISAQNNYGTSLPDFIKIYTNPSRDEMPEYTTSGLTWLIEPTTPTLIVLIVIVVALLIAVDLIFHFFYQMGATYMLRSACCPSKGTSVLTDKSYT